MLSARTRLLIFLLLGTLINLVLIGWEQIPLGVPGEWTWPRISPDANSIIHGLIAIAVLGIYFAFLWFGQQFLGRNQIITSLLLAGMTLGGAASIFFLRGAPGGIFGTSSLTWITYYPRMSGYFTQAVEGPESTSEFLSNYEQAVREGDYLHQGTHPPGLILWFRGGLNLVEHSPALRSLLLATEPPSVAEGSDVLQQLAEQSGQRFPDRYRALLWLNVMLTLLFTSLVSVLLFLLIRQLQSEDVAWWLAACWSVFPSLALFLPKSDLLLPLISVLMILFWTFELDHKKTGWAMLCGMVCWVGMMISLAIVVIPVILAAWTILGSLASKKDADNYAIALRDLPWLAGLLFLTGIALPTLLMFLFYDINLISVWMINLSKHAEFYDHNVRTYWLWLLVNPLELIVSAGWPITFLAGFFLVKSTLVKPHALSVPLAITIAATWALLWLSGKNMGEAARLWIFLHPLLLVIVGICWPKEKLDGSSDLTPSLPILFCLQAFITLYTTTHVDGFDFATLLR